MGYTNCDQSKGIPPFETTPLEVRTRPQQPGLGGREGAEQFSFGSVLVSLNSCPPKSRDENQLSWEPGKNAALGRSPGPGWYLDWVARDGV